MPGTIICFLAVIALVLAIINQWSDRPPLKVTVLLLALIEALRCLPLGK